MQPNYFYLINEKASTGKPISGIQQEPIIRPRWSMNKQKDFVSGTRMSRTSSKVSHFTPQIDTTRQSNTNDGIVKNMTLGIHPFHELRLISSLPSQSITSTIHQQKSLKPNTVRSFHSRILTPTDGRFLRSSKVSSFATSSNSIGEIKASVSNSLKSQLTIQSKKTPRRRQKPNKINRKPSKRRFIKAKTVKFNQTGMKKNINPNRKLCCRRSRYCLLLLIPMIMLLMIGLTGMFVGIFANKTTTTSTTSTTATTSTSTTSTSTTTTTTTSTTTSTTTTSTTSTTTSTTSSTSSTSTSSTSTTSITTTSQTTTTSTSTTTTTAHPCGTSVSVGSSSNLYYATSGSTSSYTCQYFEWTASTTGSVTLAFELRNDIAFWYLDDVSVSNGTTELLINGGFESNSFSPGWTKTPSGTCSLFTPGGDIDNSSPHTGTYHVLDKCWNPGDVISQSFVVTTGQVYLVSFWSKSSVNVVSMEFTVTLS